VLARHKRKTLERIEAGKFDAALLSANKWVGMDPSAEALYALALCYSKTGKHQLAVGHLEELRKLEHVELHLKMIQIQKTFAFCGDPLLLLVSG